MITNLKYSPDLYINCDFYGNDDTEIANYSEKLVKIRVPHKCVNCQKEIEKGNYMLLEKGFIDNSPVSCYTCVKCIESWLEESGQVELEKLNESV